MVFTKEGIYKDLKLVSIDFQKTALFSMGSRLRPHRILRRPARLQAAPGHPDCWRARRDESFLSTGRFIEEHDGCDGSLLPGNAGWASIALSILGGDGRGSTLRAKLFVVACWPPSTWSLRAWGARNRQTGCGATAKSSRRSGHQGIARQMHTWLHVHYTQKRPKTTCQEGRLVSMKAYWTASSTARSSWAYDSASPERKLNAAVSLFVNCELMARLQPISFEGLAGRRRWWWSALFSSQFGDPHPCRRGGARLDYRDHSRASRKPISYPWNRFGADVQPRDYRSRILAWRRNRDRRIA